MGDTVTIEGSARNAKLGAMIHGDETSYFIDGLDEWPDELDGQQLRVTGRIITRDDLPVFEEQPGDLPKTGIPVPAGTTDAARTRRLLANASWELINPSP